MLNKLINMTTSQWIEQMDPIERPAITLKLNSPLASSTPKSLHKSVEQQQNLKLA